jgi:hypothetical protein
VQGCPELSNQSNWAKRIGQMHGCPHWTFWENSVLLRLCCIGLANTTVEKLFTSGRGNHRQKIVNEKISDTHLNKHSVDIV